MDFVLIERMTQDHWTAVESIYNAGIATKNATFEPHVPDWASWNSHHRGDCRLIALKGERIAGFAALSDISARIVYSGVAEVSIYVDPDFRGMGIGDQLLKTLIAESETHNIWTLQAGIFPENIISLQLHLRNGFRIIGKRERIGKMDGRWRDVLLLERRSEKVGIE
jgi:L-amino acid N-acyltransferase YncA